MHNENHRELEDEIYNRQVGICKAFANPTRLRILDMIASHEETSTNLQRKLGVSTANLSQHLAVLKAAGVIVTHRESKNVHCSLAIPEVKQACRLIRNVLRAQLRNGRRLDAQSGL
jgi:DNA-binding transcriptional ArsR family regulator